MIKLYDYKLYYFKASFKYHDSIDSQFFKTGMTFSIRARSSKNAWPAAKRYIKQNMRGKFCQSIDIELLTLD
jgi:hypothetical protein